MKVSELRELSSDDLLQKEKTLKKDIFELNQQRELGAVEKPSRFSLIKKDIARIHTILKEREIENERNTAKRK
jgi:large subunit ribosomal protein L29